ncbi:TPA: YncE family protein [Candidatus Poribacteria bacterium]|nr:YncE family protein [Candidatus Poribacteria bacterium]
MARKIVKKIPIGGEPSGIARKDNFLYVANSRQNTVFVIDIQRHAIHKVIPVGANPTAVAASPKRNFVYVANSFDDTVSIIDTVNQNVSGEPIRVGHQPSGLAVDGGYDDGDVVYVTNYQDRSLSVIDIATRTETDKPITVGTFPIGAAVLDGGDKIYVVNSGSDDVSILRVE